jgi:glycosyltransferase involved in cell wall biosynthesis
VRNADTIRVEAFDTEDGPVTLPEIGPGWCWIGVSGCRPQAVNLSLEGEAVALALDNARGRPSALAAADEPFRPTIGFTALDADAEPVECCVATLPEILSHLLDAAGDSTGIGEAVATLLEQCIAGERPDASVLEGYASTVRFDLLRGCILVARHLGKFAAEVALIEQALEVRPSHNLERLLSMALANAQDHARARETARAVVAADPNIAETAFGAHLAELDAHDSIMAELNAPAPAQTETLSVRIGYCAHNALPYENKGYAMRSHGLAKALAEAGREITVFARPGFPSDGAKDRAPSGTENVDGIDYVFENGFGRRGRCYGYIAEAADYYERTFAEHGIGIVQAASNFWTGLPAGIAARRLGLPFVYEVRSFWDITREAREPGFRKTPQATRDNRLEAETLKLASHVVTLNTAMRERIASLGIDPERITIVPNSVDPEAFAPQPRDAALAKRCGIAEGDTVIGYAGAMLAYEGLDLLLEAAGPLLAGSDRLKLLLIGAKPAQRTVPGSIEHRLAEQIRDAGLEDNAILADQAPPEAMPALYGLFDICAYPRRAFEVCELVSPLKPLEAMAAGKAIVIADVGGMRGMVTNDKTGLTHPPGNVEALRDALRRFTEDADFRSKVGKAARAHVTEHRSWRAAAKALETVYAMAT